MRSKVYFKQVVNSRDVLSTGAGFKQLIRESKLCDDFKQGELIAIKTHMGEKGNTGHVDAAVIRNLVDQLKSQAARPFVTDTNVLYPGQRDNAIDHMILADEHGFELRQLGCPVFIADGLLGENAVNVVINKKHFTEVSIAKPVIYLENLVSIAHVTGHMLTGFAASIKNMGMGLASRAGKSRQHSNIKPHVKDGKCELCGNCIETCPAQAIIENDSQAFILEDVCIGCAECLVACKFGAMAIDYGENAKILTEKMVEYCYGALLNVTRKVFFNFAIRITKNCDCMARDEPEIIEDIGILASRDPVACDKAASDMVLERAQKNIFQEGYPEACNVMDQLNYAHEIGLGSLDYDLISIE